MIGLKINNTWLNLFPNTSLNITIRNPLFDIDAIERVFSYPFNLPTTPHNMNVFGYSNRLDVEADTHQFDAQLWIDGAPFEEGILIVQNPNEKSIKCIFQNKSMGLVEEFSEKKIKELTYPNYGFTFIPKVYLKLDISTQTTQTQSIINIEGVEFTGGTSNLQSLVDDINTEFPGLASWDDAFPSEKHLTLSPDKKITVKLLPGPFSPTAFLFFEQRDYVDWTNSSLLQSNVFWSVGLNTFLNNPATVFNFDFAVPTMRLRGFFNKENPNYNNLINEFENGNYLIPTSPGAEPSTFSIYNDHTFVPFIYNKTVLDAIKDNTTIEELGGDFYTNTELSKLIIHNVTPLDTAFNDRHYHDIRNSDLDESTKYSPGWKGVINYADHIPFEGTVKEYLLALAQQFGLIFIYQNNTFYLRLAKNILNSPVQDWTSKAEPAYDQEPKQFDGFEIDYDRQDDTTDYLELDPLTSGAGDFEYLLPFFTYEDLIHSAGTRAILVPSHPEQANISINNPAGTLQIETSATLRLLFFRGLQNDNEGNSYPMASYSNYDFAGNKIGDYSLAIDGTDGLYQQFLSEYINLLQKGKEVEKIIRLDIQDIINEKEFKTPRKKIFHPMGEMIGVIKSIQIKASVKGLSPAKVTFVKQ